MGQDRLRARTDPVPHRPARPRERPGARRAQGALGRPADPRHRGRGGAHRRDVRMLRPRVRQAARRGDPGADHAPQLHPAGALRHGRADHAVERAALHLRLAGGAGDLRRQRGDPEALRTHPPTARSSSARSARRRGRRAASSTSSRGWVRPRDRRRSPIPGRGSWSSSARRRRRHARHALHSRT